MGLIFKVHTLERAQPTLLDMAVELVEQIFFFIGNKTFIDKNEHHVHDDEHSEHEIKTHGSRTKTNRL